MSIVFVARILPKFRCCGKRDRAESKKNLKRIFMRPLRRTPPSLGMYTVKYPLFMDINTPYLYRQIPPTYSHK